MSEDYDEIDNRLWHEYMDLAEIQDKIHEYEDYELDLREYLEYLDYYYYPTYFYM